MNKKTDNTLELTYWHQAFSLRLVITNTNRNNTCRPPQLIV